VYFNLFITFLLSGFWHGANWTYIIWGGLNGVYLITSQMTKGIRSKVTGFIGLDKFPLIHKMVQATTTFTLIMFSWIFFRADNLGEALYIIRNMFNGIFDSQNIERILKTADQVNGFGRQGIYLSFTLIAFLVLTEVIQRKTVIRNAIDARFSYLGWTVYYAAIFIIILLGQFTKTQFIYFQF
jgi:alginate O-acetyltransferase complex protein AlgI